MHSLNKQRKANATHRSKRKSVSDRKKTRNIDSSFRCTCLSDVQNKQITLFVTKPVGEYWNFYPQSYTEAASAALASGTQVRGFKPGLSRRIFRAKKNPQHAFLRRGSKAIGSMSQLWGL
jgi:hypothetical protein